MSKENKSTFQKTKNLEKSSHNFPVNKKNECPEYVESDNSVPEQTDSKHFHREQSKKNRKCYINHKCSKCCHSIELTSKKLKLMEQEKIEKLRAELMLRLNTCKLEDAIAKEKHQNLEIRLVRVSEVINALVHFIDSCLLEQKSLNRFCTLLNALVCNEECFALSPHLCQILQGLCQKPTNKFVIEIKRTLIEYHVSRKLQTLLLEYKQKTKDFEIASRNFLLLLDENQLGYTQLEKLQRQYEQIIVSYQHCRVLLDQELPGVIQSRLRLLTDSCIELSHVMKKQSELNIQVQRLFKSFFNPKPQSAKEAKFDLVGAKVSGMKRFHRCLDRGDRTYCSC